MVLKHSTTPRRFELEALEPRLNLAGNGLADGSCLFDTPAASSGRAARAVNCFASDLYEQLQHEDGNLAFSPLSISTALAMTYLGAANQTAEEMEQLLHFGEQPGIHESFGALLQALDQAENRFEPELANALWTQAGFAFHQAFLDGVITNYHGYARNVDYIEDPEGARELINNWVAEQTEDRIAELVPAGFIDTLTRIVLTNTIYYNAAWSKPFGAHATSDRPFYKEDGEVVDVPTMYETSMVVPYTQEADFEVLELPYASELVTRRDHTFATGTGPASMVILLPKGGHSVDELTPEILANVNRWLDGDRGTRTRSVDVMLPKFKVTVDSDLGKVLAGMGAAQMFSPAADFSNMTDATGFHVTGVVHEAFLEIDEEGTEAAAATAVFGGFACFAAGTPVLTPTGERTIETLKVGDHVLSRHQHNVKGPIEPKEIIEVFKSHKEIVEVHLGGQVIRTTSRHPFFVKGQGWTAAVELQPDDSVATDLSSWIEIERVVRTGKEEPVYNFHVADHHTYFVGSESWGFHAWVHNCSGVCPPPAEVEFKADRPFHFLIRDNETSAIMFMGRIDDPLQENNSLDPTFEASVPIETTTERLVGDANDDDAVNFADFLVLANNFGKTEDAVFAEGDFDGNGAVDFADFLVLRENYGESHEG